MEGVLELLYNQDFRTPILLIRALPIVSIIRKHQIHMTLSIRSIPLFIKGYGLKGKSAKILVEFAKDFMEKKKRPFSLYKTLTDLKSVLNKFNIYGSSLSAVPQFTLFFLSLADDDNELQQCMNDIKRKLCNLGTLIPDSNEVTRNDYISAILHTAIHITRRETDKEISLLLQLQIVGDENCGCVDYAIISLEELICITESKQYLVNIAQVES
ncbi:unnamed protein product [Rhizophagus irregularis]|nr:unnamed protein product [Rhizophagus irregularis]